MKLKALRAGCAPRGKEVCYYVTRSGAENVRAHSLFLDQLYNYLKEKGK